MDMKKGLKALSLFVAGLACTAVLAGAGSNGVRTFRWSSNGHRYEYHPGQMTRDQAWEYARARGGYPVVFSSMAEHRAVANALNYRQIAPAHTGHYQDPRGREPGMGWLTYTGERSAPLNDLFNSNGPDDGIRNKWGWNFTDDGAEVFYGPSNGKNEDAGVLWHDNAGRLEDVSVNHRCGVIIEYNN
jgi:hypothetical protein